MRLRRLADAACCSAVRFRCVILTASIGAGHDLPAEILRQELIERRPGAEVEVLDCLALAGGLIERAISSASFESPLANRLFDVQIRLLHDVRATRRAAGRFGELLAGRPVLRALAERRADVVVSTYPGSTEVLGRLRRSGRLRIPAVAAITDLAALTFWAHPGIDLHLVTQAESIPELRAIAGPQTEVVHVRGLDDPRFADPPSRGGARPLDLPVAGPVIVVSGGGWAVGDLRGAAEEALAVPGATVLVLCGSRDDVRSALAALLRRVAARARARLHRSDARRAGRRRRPDPLDGGADGHGGAGHRLRGDLLRLGPRAHPR